VRLALGVLGVMALLLIPALQTGGTAGYSGATLYGWADRLLGVWTRWDGQWYLKIADAGYVGPGSSAFYPLYPALVKSLGIVLFPLGPYRYIVAALLISGVAFYFALALLHAATLEATPLPNPPLRSGREIVTDPLSTVQGGINPAPTDVAATEGGIYPAPTDVAATEGGINHTPTDEPTKYAVNSSLITNHSSLAASAADNAILYLAVFPTAFFFFAAYSESLFLLLAIASLYAARRSQWWLAGAAAALAILTRSFGLALFIPLLYEYWRQARVGRGWRRDVVALALPPLALTGLAAFAYVRFGDPAAFLSSQGLWFRRFSLPWYSLWRGLSDVVNQPLQYATDNMNLTNLAAALLFVLLAILVWRALPAVYCLYLDIGVLLTLSSAASAEPLLSVSRFVVVLFPAFMLLGMAGARSRTFHLVWLLISVMLLALYFIRFANWFWVA
jgi:hypothetical protein